jgi:hypothetical protein
MDCVDACPHDNVAVLSINRTEDLVNDSHRSGVGRFGQRFDLAAMIVLLFFAALVNAAWMTAPVLALEDSFVRRLGLGRLPVMIAGLLFVMIGLPIFLMQAVATTSNRASGSDGGDDAVRANIAKFAPSLIPLSLSMWLAHYCFHFATSFDGWRLASERASADWAGTAFEFGPIAMACCKANSVPWLLPGELVVLGIGLCASFAVAYRIGDRGDATPRDRAAIIPWVLLMLTFYAASVWVLLQPMQMRGALTVGM